MTLVLKEGIVCFRCRGFTAEAIVKDRSGQADLALDNTDVDSFMCCETILPLHPKKKFLNNM